MIEQTALDQPNLGGDDAALPSAQFSEQHGASYEGANFAAERTEIIADLPASETISPRDRVGALLERLKITRVVLVDDMITPVADAATVSETLEGAPHSHEAFVSIFPAIDLSEDNEHRLVELTAALDAMEANELDDVLNIVREHGVAGGLQDMLRLRENIPSSVQLDLLEPQQWHERGNSILQECGEDNRALLLFDQELKSDPSLLGFATGADIIKSLSQSDPDGFGTRWFCGMLSHTLAAGDEVDEWRKLADDHSIALKFFMPIAKQNLEDGERFYGAVFRTLINTYCETMKTLAKTGLQDALSEAVKRFEAIDPLAFEHVVVKSSADEGVSELETLLRVYGILHRDEAKRIILKEASVFEFSNAASKVKEVADISRVITPETASRLNELRAQELYEAGDLVNGYHDPLRNGDVFEIGAGEQTCLYVLIAQPCDIMVRADGKRVRENNFKVAVLCPLTLDGTEIDSEPAHLSYKLTHFGLHGEHRAAALLKRATVANLSVLDLAVLNKDGRCEIATASAPDGAVSPTRAWQARFLQLTKQFKRIAKRIEDVRAKFGDEVAALVAEAVLPRVGMSAQLAQLGSYAAGSFGYPIRRISHVRDPSAASLLAAFSSYLSRDAFEHDFAR